MSDLALDQFIQSETSFITDTEEIVDILYEMETVYFYDNSALSPHEMAYNKHHDLLFYNYSENAPILITDTIANEMRIMEDHAYRYLSYLSNFRKVLYVKEENLIDLLKVDYEITAARRKFLIASEKAFMSIQWLKERVKESKRSFSTAEKVILCSYQSFFSENNNENRGELSLIWVSAILEQLPGNIKVNFVGIDHDLYDFVERSYFTEKVNTFSNQIYILSNDTLLQSYYRNTTAYKALASLVPIHRFPNRKTRFHRKINKVLNLNQQKKKLTNEDFQRFLVDEEIEIIY
ncbi:hypothetical protein FH966_02470 [Lentibacillus cibarius]|uniref:Uncharacterized protein n=1 Tax=Lentibacillus cibarius TaxID=2583219 RepID=A0A549YFL5_9BACI|nr:hypothetical protein [Lentibacillus cibarius]TRM10673.1 hypothetical protein FH966_02470 [Lentibacillus cibarius]